MLGAQRKYPHKTQALASEERCSLAGADIALAGGGFLKSCLPQAGTSEGCYRTYPGAPETRK